ncbi:MAG: peptidase M4 [Tuberibacillus sp.]
MKTTQSLVAAFGIGLVAGYFAGKAAGGGTLNSERALAEVKAALNGNMDIDGAWIYSQPEEWENGKLRQTVYHGGLTENKDGEAVHYDFVVDARTGTIIQFTQQ